MLLLYLFLSVSKGRFNCHCACTRKCLLLVLFRVCFFLLFSKVLSCVLITCNILLRASWRFLSSFSVECRRRPVFFFFERTFQIHTTCAKQTAPSLNLLFSEMIAVGVLLRIQDQHHHDDLHHTGELVVRRAHLQGRRLRRRSPDSKGGGRYSVFVTALETK
jgi:hypothetical protein